MHIVWKGREVVAQQKGACKTPSLGVKSMETTKLLTTVDLELSSQFLRSLTGSDERPVTFQTFPDRSKTSGIKLTRVLHGTLAEHAAELTRLNNLGAGIFVVVNETDLTGRKAENVTAVRALFVDFDDAGTSPLQIIETLVPAPHIVVESSPGKAHAYWLVSDCELGNFTRAQAALAAHLGGDPVVKDLSRVMRLPGFAHQKGGATLTRIVSTSDSPSHHVTDLLRQLIGMDFRLVDDRHKPGAATQATSVDAGTAARDEPFNLPVALAGAPEGSRNDTMFRLACSLRARAFGAEEARVLILEAAARCSPPLPQEQALKCLDQAWKYPEGGALHHMTELGNAKRLVAKRGECIRWIPEFKKWMLWTGTRWRFDEANEVMLLAKETSQDIYAEAATATDSKIADAIGKHAAKSQSLRTLKALLELAQTEPGIPVLQAALDTGGMLLGVANGVLDLLTGKLRRSMREDYITRQAHVAYDASAACPKWDAFLLGIMGGDVELVRFLQRAVGYSLTGSSAEQCLFFLYGTGRNGKSTFLGTLRDVLGDYASQCSSETLMVRQKEGGASGDIARLRGARFVSTIEAEDGRRLAESLVKQLTGGDPIVARFLFQEEFEFRPQFKIWFAANHKPIIRGDDLAIWRRIHLVPFTVTIPDNDIDKSLSEKLAAEAPGILNWAIRGCLEWQRDGLRPPQAVRDATDTYRIEMDHIGGWLADCCICGLMQKDTSKRLYESYRRWCEDAGAHPLGMVKFAQKLVERGFLKQRNSQGVQYQGIAWRGSM